jgi:hypothetical protein
MKNGSGRSQMRSRPFEFEPDRLQFVEIRFRERFSAQEIRDLLGGRIHGINSLGPVDDFQLQF